MTRNLYFLTIEYDTADGRKTDTIVVNGKDQPTFWFMEYARRHMDRAGALTGKEHEFSLNWAELDHESEVAYCAAKAASDKAKTAAKNAKLGKYDLPYLDRPDPRPGKHFELCDDCAGKGCQRCGHLDGFKEVDN